MHRRGLWPVRAPNVSTLCTKLTGAQLRQGMDCRRVCLPGVDQALVGHVHLCHAAPASFVGFLSLTLLPAWAAAKLPSLA